MIENLAWRCSLFDYKARLSSQLILLVVVFSLVQVFNCYGQNWYNSNKGSTDQQNKRVNNSTNLNNSSSVFSNHWINYGSDGGKKFYFSETAVTEKNEPFLTCMAGSGTDYVLGSRASGLFSFSSSKRKFRALSGAQQLVDKKITTLALGPSRKEIWAGTFFNGLYHRKSDGRWENFGGRDGLYSDSVTSVIIAKDVVFVGTDSGISKIVAGRVSRTSVTKQVFDMAYDKTSGRCYAGHMSANLSVYDPSTTRWTTVDMGIKPASSFNNVLVEPTGDILCGGFSGVFRISARNGQVVSLSDQPSEKLISCLSLGEDGIVYVGFLGKRLGIHSLEGDTYNNLFHGTGVFTQTNAVARNNRKEWIIISFGRLWHFTDRFLGNGFLPPADSVFNSPQSASNSSSFAFTNANTVSDSQWGGKKGKGFDVNNLPSPTSSVNRSSSVSNNLQNSTFTSGAVSSSAFRKIKINDSVTALSNTVSRLWAGTKSGKLYTVTSSGEVTLARTFDSPVSDLLYSDSGRLYIVTGNQKIYTFTGFSYKLLGSVPSKIHDLAGNLSSNKEELWIGTSNGLYKYDGNKISKSQFSSSLPDQNITSIIVDGDTLWVGTRLGLVHLVEGRWTVHSESDGLPSKNILSLTLLNGRLWVGTGDGIAVFSGRRFNVVNNLVARNLSVYGSTVIGAGNNGLALFVNGRWNKLISLPGNGLNTVVNGGEIVSLGMRDGLFIINASELR